MVLNDPLLLRIGELLLYIWKQVFVIVILINTVQRYFFYFIGQNISLENGSFKTCPCDSLNKVHQIWVGSKDFKFFPR